MDKQPAGRRSRTRRFADEHSDFLTCLNLWHYLQEQQQRAVRQRVPPACASAEFLHYLRDPRVAGPAQPAAQAAEQVGLDAAAATAGRGRRRPRSTSRCWPGCCRTSGCRDAREARVPRRPRRPVRASSRARRCSSKQPQLGDGGRAGRDHAGCGPAVNARIDPAWVEPLAGHLVKRSYSEPHWSSKRRGAAVALRAGHALRRAARRRRAGGLRPDRPRGVPRAVHPPRAGRGRLGHPPPRSSTTTARCSSGVERARAPRAAPRHPRRRRDAGRRSTTSGCPPTSSPRGTSTRGGRRRAARQPDLLTFTEDAAASATTPAAISRRGLPATSGSRASSSLPVTYQFEPGRRGRRRHRAHPGRRAQPGRRTTGSTGRCPACAQELATALLQSLPKATRRALRPRARPRRRPRWPTATRPAGALAHRRARPRPCRRAPASRCDPRTWDWSRGAGPPADHLPRRGRAPAGRSPRARTCAALQDRLAPQMRRRWSQPAGAAWSAPGCAVDASARCRATFARASGERGRRRASPRWSTTVDSVALRCCRREPERTAPPGSACDGCCCSTTHRAVEAGARAADNPTKLALGHNPHGSVPALLDDCVALRRRRAVAERHGELPCDDAGFARLQAAVRAELPDTAYGVVVEPWRGSWRRRTTCPRGSRRHCRPGRAAGLARHPQPGGARWCTRASSPPPAADRLRDLQRYLTRGAAPARQALPAPGPRRRADGPGAGGRAGARERGWPGCGRRGAAHRTCRRCGGCWRSCGSACSPSSSARRHPISEKRIYRAMDAADS